MTSRTHIQRPSAKFVTALVAVAILGLAASSRASADWETLVDGSSFNSPAAFARYWNYNYPWGTDHNGTARMNATNVTVAAGAVTIVSHVTDRDEGFSASPPHLPIRYDAGTIYLKQQLTISRQYPVWNISGQFMVPTNVGTWPAFWMTGAHSWPPESDFMEFKGHASCNQNTYSGKWQVKITPVPDASTVWHTYGVVATLRSSTNVDFRYFIDGKMESDQLAPTFVDSPCWLIVDFQMEGDSGKPGPDETACFRMKNIVVKRQKSFDQTGDPYAN